VGLGRGDWCVESPGATGSSHTVKEQPARPSTKKNDITVHGFRSTFRDWAAERTGYPNHVVEMALAHTIESKVEAAYRRGDLFEKRRRLAADWERYYISGLCTSAAILPIKKAS
jgi:integrase